MKIKLSHACLSLALLLVSHYQAISQQVNAVSTAFSPATFPGYPYNGNFTATFSKTAGTVPAGTAQVVFTMVPELPYDGKTIIYPTGWTVAPTSTSTNIRFMLTSDWTTDGTITFTIPVRSENARSSNALGVTSQIQQIDGDWALETFVQRAKVTIDDNQLPVTLLHFTASKEGTSARLNWATAEETNSDRFAVEHSLNGANWNNIGDVPSRGESVVLQTYQFLHEMPSDGENLYRLKMIDKDRTFAYSKIQVLNFTNLEAPIIYPNPSAAFITVKDPAQLKSITIYDVQGKVMLTSKAKNMPKTIDISSLGNGMYVLEYVTEKGMVRTSKLTVLR